MSNWLPEQVPASDAGAPEQAHRQASRTGKRTAADFDKLRVEGTEVAGNFIVSSCATIDCDA